MKILTPDTPAPAEKSVATIGVFDGVHRGHEEVLSALRREARHRGLSSMVVTFPLHPRLELNPRTDLKMILTPHDKIDKLSSAGVNFVLLFPFADIVNMSAAEFMCLLRDSYGVQVLVMGFDHRFGHDRPTHFDDYVAIGKKLGMDVVREKEYCADDALHISSSEIRRALLRGEISSANAMLGYSFEICGKVVRGEQNGRKIGFPTANVESWQHLIVPSNGVYAARVDVDGVTYGAMCNIGTRPTVSDSMRRSIEVNIFDFNEDIYGKEIIVRLVVRTREERKFASLAELQERLQADKEEILALLKKDN